ncbi:glycosyltransferase family 2 protein [Candidatus Pelagibacter sp. Uisw_130]|uniref:glycosyltransferase family 2 protein n=1 Tax=Candidatus Pelagibacter sp. Uisw_130 TaxID=3230989 RepID=UPI0039EC7586
MINNRPIKYSILLPTYNKAKYLAFTIESVLSSKYENFELIISDDYSTDDTNKLLSQINDKRVNIIKPPIKLTQTKNYEFLLKYARGEWITILGDDDGILPNFFEKVDKYLDKFYDVEAIHTKPAFYYWDGVEDLYGDRVCDYQNFNEKSKMKNSMMSLLFSLSGIYLRTDLPMIYTSGLVKKSLLDKIKKKSNNFFFHSVVPDYYSMISILYETKKYLQINEPIFWAGTSKLSTGRSTKIYEDKTNKDISLDKFDFINPNLKLSGDISEKLHQIGLSSIYFFECVIDHPYINNKWKSNFIKYLVYASSCIQFYKINLYYNYRSKINLNLKEFNMIISLELKKNRLSRVILMFFLIPLLLIDQLKKSFLFLYRIKKFIIKKTSKKKYILVSSDRKKFRNIIDCNLFIKNNLNSN